MKYSAEKREELFSLVLEKLCTGLSLRQILSKEGAPSRTAFYKWVDEVDGYAERFARACAVCDDVLFDESLDIARTPMIGETVKDGPNGVEVTTADMLGHRKLLIETIHKILARRNPRKYGDKIDVTSDNKQIALPPIIGMVIQNKTFDDGCTDDLL